MILVVVGCGTAVATQADVVAAALAFGIAIVILAYSVGRLSGSHVNPAISLAVFINSGMDWVDLLGYIVSQFLGAIAGSAILGAFFKGYDATGANLAPNVAGDSKLIVAFVIEVVLTFLFVLAVLGITSKKDESSKANGLFIGLALTGVHLVGIKLTGTSVNPARGFSASLFAAIGGNSDSLTQVWIWILAPLVGAVIAAFLWKLVFHKEEKAAPAEEPKAEYASLKTN